MTSLPLFPLACSGAFALHGSGAVRAVFGAVGAGEKPCAAYAAPFPVQPVKQVGFQLLVLRQYRRSKPAAQQRIGNTLDADTFLSIVQRKAVPGIVVAAGMYQPPHFAILPVVHDGDSGKHSVDLQK